MGGGAEVGEGDFTCQPSPPPLAQELGSPTSPSAGASVWARPQCGEQWPLSGGTRGSRSRCGLPSCRGSWENPAPATIGVRGGDGPTHRGRASLSQARTRGWPTVLAPFQSGKKAPRPPPRLLGRWLGSQTFGSQVQMSTLVTLRAACLAKG